MAFTAEDYGRSVAAPGLVFPDQPYSTVSRCMAEGTESEGGFPVFANKGEDVKAYATKPAGADAVARVVEVTVGGTVAENDKYSVTIGSTKYEVTAGNGDTASDVATALATAVDADTNYGASASDGKVTITASTAGAAANADVFAVATDSTAGTIAKVEKTAGADAVEAGYFLGIAQRIQTRDEYPVGTPVTVVTTGMIWVAVGGDVKSGDDVALDSDGKFVAYDSTDSTQTAISGGKFMSTAPSGAYAVVALK